MKNKNLYTKLWNEVTRLEKASLPKSAADQVDAILKQAVLDKNSPQVIKALIHQGKYELALDAENDTSIFLNLQEMAQTSEGVEKAVVHSMLGELYLQYYQKDRWNIDQRTEMGDFVPDDMKEWTRGILLDKVVEHLNASIEEQEILEETDVESYAEVVLLGKDSRRYYPSMYDFLARRAIELLSQIDADEELTTLLARKEIAMGSLFAPFDQFIEIPFNPQPSERELWSLETYRKLLASLYERGMNVSILLLELDKLDYLAQWQSAHDTYARPTLDRMLDEWEGIGVSVEIIDRIANGYQNELREQSPEDSVQQEQKAKELYELLQGGIKRYATYERVGIIENQLEILTRPEFTVSGNKTFPSGQQMHLDVAFKNLQSLNAKLYRVSSPKEVETARYGVRRSVSHERRFVKDIPVQLPEREPYLQGSATVDIDAMEPGTYMLEFSSLPEASSPQSAIYYFAVSDLSVFTRSPSRNKYDFFVVHRVTGQPVPNASIILYKLPGNWRNSELTEVTTLPVNKQGMAVYHKEIRNNDVFYHAVMETDRGSLLSRLPYTYWGYTSDTNTDRESVAIFTDRGLYRPGQTVHFKAIATRVKGTESSVVAGRNAEFILRDANGRELSTLQLMTNEFGSASGEFTLPTGIMTGGFTITTEGGSTHFQVEEYKRPTFEITFDTIRQTYKFGEEIALKGKAESYSGIKLNDAVVQYRITRQQMRWWGWLGSSDHFSEGVVRTDSDGAFTILFTPDKPDTYQQVSSIYSFVVEATVTDVNGETQSGTYTLSVGDVSMILSLEMVDQWEKESNEKVVISARNLDGSDVEASGAYHVYSLLENDSIHQLVAEGEFVTGDQPLLKEKLSALPSGKYRVKLTSVDDRGNPVEAEKEAILFSYSDKRPPVKTNAWFLEKNAQFGVNQPAEVILGATSRLHVLYELWQGNDLLERKWVELNNENRLFSVPYKAEYGNGVTLMLTYVKEEQFYTHRSDFRPVKENKELSVKLDVFRDRVRPGAHEEWRISVTDTSGNPAPAEVLASMYDFSLDQIYPSQPWNLFVYSPDRYYSRMGLSSDHSFQKETISGYITMQMKTVKPFEFDRFNWFDYSLFYYGRMLLRSSSMNVMLESAVADSRQLKEMELAYSDEDAASPPPPGELSGKGAGAEAPIVRRDFNETAFFYPSLRTNEAGETTIAFIVPESNTRWRFRVLAHDKQLNQGQAEAFTVSQKELMVTPNMPRFLRHGDRASIATKISNLSDSTVAGNATLEFFDPVTDEPLENIQLTNTSRLFSLAPNASSEASWSFDVPEGIDLIGVRIVARGDHFSDGEQHALAVLPNRMLVTESKRMDVRANETKTFTMEGLTNRESNTIKDYRLTLEFTSNPAWYAVQALPVLGEPVSDNAVAWFASYYANSLGGHIAQAYPKVMAMVEAWKKQGGSNETLLSNLEKNPELKSVLLEETPWILEAKNESEQQQKLALLFNLNRNNHLTRTAIDKLVELQTNQGGWSWFKGFRPNIGITHYILYGFNQLKELGAMQTTHEIESMQKQAVGYIDAEAIRRFDALKKYNKEWRKITSISTTDLEYLFVRTVYSEFPLDEETRELADFYLSVIQNNWTNYGLYERSLIALLMEREGKTPILQAILASFREHATHDDEMGMYWPNNRAHVFMSQSALSVHTFIMAAFGAGEASAAEMDEMKRWLLKQKQTQLWESTHATMDAVYTLLSTGSDWFASTGETTIHVGDQLVEPESRELGSGYFKTSWGGTEIVPDMGHVRVAHQGPTAAWGALYWQYYEEMDKIVKTDGSLDIEKQLFVEEVTSTGAQLARITPERPLKVGDKVVVRLVLRSDRDLEFVHLKDTRAASFEPIDQVSNLSWQNGIPYYYTSGDASTNFYFDTLPRGTYVFEYSIRVSRVGNYSNGITTVQCMYAPEFISRTAGIRVTVTE